MNFQQFIEQRLAPFKFKHFRNLYMAQGLSLVGSWMQELAKSWIVLNLMGNAKSLGALLFAAAVPNLILGSLGGTFADQRGAKQTLVVTQVALATLAFALGVLVSSGSIHYWHLIVFALMEGSILAFDVPAFNMVTPKLVPRENFQQALALNSVNFHLSRVIGPSIAGLVMGFWGPQSVFWINAVSFIGVVGVIARLPIEGLQTRASQAPKRMRDVLHYLRRHPLFFRILLQFVVMMALVFPLMFTTLRFFIKDKFNLSAKQFGFVFATPGLGALIGSLSFLLWSPANPVQVLPFGVVGIVVSLLAVANAPSLALTVLCLVFLSFSMFLTLSALLVTVQLKVEDEMRGRVSALIGMGFVSISPIMSVPIGWFSDLIGGRRLLEVMAISFGLASISLAIYRRDKTTT